MLRTPNISFGERSLRVSHGRERLWLAAALAVYAGLMVYIIPRHEPWADEAQAWELATSTSLRALFGTFIHYEGSPALWHMFLRLLSHLGVTYTGLHWVCGAIACGTTALVLYRSPFPLPLRLVLPFTYFFLFQYAVVARSYVLFPFLLFLLAGRWPARWQRPWPVVVLLALVANVSAHAWMVAFGLVLVLLLEVRNTPRQTWMRWHTATPLALTLCVALGFGAWCIFPAKDAGWLYVARQSLSLRTSTTAASAAAPTASAGNGRNTVLPAMRGAVDAFVFS